MTISDEAYNSSMQVEDLGEFGVIERLHSLVQARQGIVEGQLLGIGDDAAAWTLSQETIIATTDTMVAGIHFLPKATPWKSVGWKAMASNLSDIAAMGGTPRFALITLGIPPKTSMAHLDSLYDGILSCAQPHGCAIVGGDIVASTVFFVTISLTGSSFGELTLRSGAKVGDRIAVTGPLGGSAGGLRLLKEKASLLRSNHKALLDAHFWPIPRVSLGRTLVQTGVIACIDISDGLVADLGKMCQSSGVAAQLNASAIPLHPAISKVFVSDPLHLALSGGEDYELLFSAKPKIMDVVRSIHPEATIIGSVIQGEPGKVEVVGEDGTLLPAMKSGWDHLDLSRE